jgi:hypothetical protein
MNTTYSIIYNKIYYRERGSGIYKYVCEDNEIDRWQAWCEEVGAERGTLEDMMGIFEGEDDHQTGLAEIIENDNKVARFFEEEEEDEITFVDIDGEPMDDGLIDKNKEEWIAMNTPMGGDPVDMNALYEAHHTSLG